ncbi:MAG: hypothetical protein ABI888_01750 [Chloroflexota bacterium]
MERLATHPWTPTAADMVQLARPRSILTQAVRVHDGFRSHAAICELDGSAIRITDTTGTREIAWPDARSVTAERGRVRIVSPRGMLDLSIALDGVVDPGLAPFFAKVLADGRRGTLSSAGALHELTRAIDATTEGFTDSDDPVIPLAIGGFAVMVGVILLAAVPFVAQLAARITPAPGTFAILPHVSVFDPRVVVAAFAAGAALAAAIARIALGSSASGWARGTLRHWHRNGGTVEDLTRRAVAHIVLYPRIILAVAAIGLVLALQPAFARTVVDAKGLHLASGLPLLSTDVPWSDVTEVVPVAVGFNERQEGFVTTLVLAGGSRVSTRGRDLLGGSERALYDFSRAHAR